MHEDMTGYRIKKKIEDSIKNFWNIGFGQIYPTLKKLEADECIRRVSVSDNDGKILYSITNQGQELFHNWLKEPKVTEYIKYEVILKMYFGSQLSFEDNIEKLNDFIHDSRQKYLIADHHSQNLSVILEENDHFYYYLTSLFGKFIHKAHIQWAEEAIQLIEARNAQSGKEVINGN